MIFIRLVMVNRRTGELREYFSRYLIAEERLAAGRRFVADDPAEGTPTDWYPVRVLPADVPR